MVAPAGPMYQAGTLSGNPLAMTAGIKTMEILKEPGTCAAMVRAVANARLSVLWAGRDGEKRGSARGCFRSGTRRSDDSLVV